jgi:uncharacterized protein YbjQ (UPF0145 family)
MPARDTTDGAAALARLRGVFDRFGANGVVKVRYRTVLVVGRPA